MDFTHLNFYHIYALGFCNAEKRRVKHAYPISHRLSAVVDYIPTLKRLGTTAIILGPLFQSESHGYDTIAYDQVDQRLGDEADLKNLVHVCHQNEIRVVSDCVFNHVGRGHFAFQDLREKGRDSAYVDWFKGIDFSKSNPCQDPFDYETWDGHYDLVKLNLKNEEVKRYLIDVALKWIHTYDFDGLRMDAANVMDQNFLRDLSRACKGVKSEFIMIGEVVGGDYVGLAKSGEFDALTNYECYKGLYSSLNDRNYFEIAYALNRQFGEQGIMKDIGLYNFVDNHDVNRVASNLLKESHLYPLYLLLYTMPGIPSVYYLSEYGQKGLRTPFSDDA
ncbi:MAG: alpha-amylase, partial [Vallitaleaceae bacterium]|nr:alpha-amylase [Vallitaleaceae bacterium]